MEIPKNEILVGDAKEKLEELPDNSVDTAMTSPPYWALRDYGKEDQFGIEISTDNTPPIQQTKLVKII